MGRNSSISTKGDVHAGFVGLGKGFLQLRPNGYGFWSHQLREIAGLFGLISDKPPCNNCWYIPGSALLHKLHHFIGHQGAVLDRVDPCQHRALHAFCAMCMGRDFKSIVFGCGHNRLDFSLGELWVLAVLGLTQHAAGRC